MAIYRGEGEGQEVVTIESISKQELVRTTMRS